MTRTLLVIAALIALANFASANPLCTSNSIAYYEANYLDINSACQVGDKLFFGFNYSGTASNATAPTNAQVQITPDPSDPTEPGLLFTAPDGTGGSLWSVSGTSSIGNSLFIDSTISFTVAVVGLQPLIIDASLNFNNQFSVSGQGVADIAETAKFNGGPSFVGLGVDSANGPFSSVKTFAPVSYLTITKDISVLVSTPRTGTNSGSASITEFREGFSEAIPEPVSMVLFGSGLAGLVALRLRR